MNRAALLRVAVLPVFLACVLVARAQTPQVLEVLLNGESRGTVLLLQVGEQLFVAEEDARQWRLRRAAVPATQFGGRSYLRLEDVGLRVERFDRAQSRIELVAVAEAFEPSALAAIVPRYAVSRAGIGGFANYDLLATRIDGGQLDGAFEFGVFSPLGVATHQFVWRNLWTDLDAPRRYERVATTFRRDWPEAALTLELGDAVSVPGATGRALRFGGIALRSNYALRPGFIRQPLPTFGAETALPSTVEVYVQNQLRSISQVPAGRFTIDDVPVILGAGQARVVVRDALGREQVVTSGFYAAGGLLRPGLYEAAFSAGRLRSADSRLGPDYGDDYVAALWRHGITDTLTLEARAEFEGGATAVVEAAANIGLRWGEIELVVAGARVGGAHYPFGAIGYRYQDVDSGIVLRFEQARRGFRFAGDTAEQPTPTRSLTASASHRIGRGVNAGLLVIDTRRPDGGRTRTAGVSASWSVGAGAALLLAASRIDDRGERSTLAGVGVVVPLGPRTSVSANVDGGSVRRRAVQLQQALPPDEGYGYRLSASHQRNVTRSEAGFSAQWSRATATGEVFTQSGQDPAWRFGLAGSLAWIDDRAFMARQLTDSFALVRVADVAGAPILVNNQPAGRTDARGALIVPRIAALLPHEIRVDADALPPDVELRRDRETIVPPFRSGVTAVLDVRRTVSALVQVLAAGGAPMPAGATVEVDPDGTATGVAGRGEFFLSGSAGRKSARMNWRGQSCVVEFDLPSVPPQGGAAYHRIGPFSCPAIRP
jgi:outer membrane usher protein